MKKLLTMLGLGFACLSARGQVDPAYPMPAAPTGLGSAEIFFDADPGVGSGSAVAVPAGLDVTATTSVATASLAPGIHRLFMRSRSSSGAWSMTLLREFLVDHNHTYAPAPAPALDVVAAEYFVDTDPGDGLATPVALAPGQDVSGIPALVAVASLPVGVHRLGLRTRDAAGRWSLASVREFAVTVDYAYPTVPAAQPAIVKAEYFFGADPGFGQATDVPLPAGTDVASPVVAVPTAGLAPGIYQLGVRTMDAAGRWSATAVQDVLVTEDYAYPAPPPAAGNLIGAEYFLDADPGFGQATPITLSPDTDIVLTSFSVNTSTLSQGLHTLYVRSRQNPWSATVGFAFSVSSPLSVSMLRFSAEARGEEALLRWEVAAGSLPRFFEVERSAEGLSWTGLGRVETAGAPAYAFTDVAPLAGTSFYRLKLVGQDGAVSFSDAQRLHFGKAPSELTIHPNPTQSVFFVEGLGGSAQLDVLSMTGTRVASFSAVQPGMACDVRALPAGTYLLRISGPGAEARTLQFVKH